MYDFDACVTLFKELICSDDYQDGSNQCIIFALKGKLGQSVNLKDDQFIPSKLADATCCALQKKQKRKDGGNGGEVSIGLSKTA